MDHVSSDEHCLAAHIELPRSESKYDIRPAHAAEAVAIAVNSLFQPGIAYQIIPDNQHATFQIIRQSRANVVLLISEAPRDRGSPYDLANELVRVSRWKPHAGFDGVRSASDDRFLFWLRRWLSGSVRVRRNG